MSVVGIVDIDGKESIEYNANTGIGVASVKI
jgi:hypothetical protein